MISKLPAKLVEDKLQVFVNGKTVELERIEAIKLRLVLNAFINGEMEEEVE